MQVHAALGASGGPRGERDERDLVGGRVHRPVRPGPGRGQPGQVPGRVPAEQGDPQAVHVRLGQIPYRTGVAQGVADPRQRADGGQLRRARLRQYGDGDPARLHDGEPAGGQPGRRRPAQQYPVARHDAQIVRQHLGDAVHRLPQLSVAPDAPVAGTQRGAVRAPFLDGAVQQFMPAVQPVGVTRRGIVQEELRPLLRRREMVAREGVGVGARGVAGRLGMRAGDAYGRVGGGCGRVRRGIRLHEGSPPCRLWSVSFG